MTLANVITLLRIAFIPLVAALLLSRINGLAAILFLALAFSDALDGYIARKFNQVSDLGKFLDPLADKILVITILLALVAQNKASVVAVMLLVARELIISGLRVNLALAGKVLEASLLAKTKTVLQILAVFMLILKLPMAALVLWLAVLLGYISGGAYLWQNKKYLLLK